MIRILIVFYVGRQMSHKKVLSNMIDVNFSKPIVFVRIM